MAHSQGDPRVQFVMNVALSSLFAYVVVRGLAFLDMLAFSWRTVAFAAALLVALTHVLIR